MEIRTECKNIEKLEVKAKIVEEVEKGEVIDRYPVTVVKFEVRGTPGDFDKLLLAVAHQHSINAVFDSAQLAFDSITFKSGDREVTLGAKGG
jgi:hypothetical protein